MFRPLLLPALAVAGGLLLAAAPGSGARQPADAGPTARAAKTYRLSADPGGRLRFTRTRITASKGSVTLRLSNPSPLPHAIAIGNRSGRTVTGGGTSQVTVRLKPGTYTYFCPVGGHRAGGMSGRLTVR